MERVVFSSYHEAVDELEAAGFKVDFPRITPVKDVVNANPPPGYPQWVGPRVLGHLHPSGTVYLNVTVFPLMLEDQERIRELPHLALGKINEPGKPDVEDETKTLFGTLAASEEHAPVFRYF